MQTIVGQVPPYRSGRTRQHPPTLCQLVHVEGFQHPPMVEDHGMFDQSLHLRYEMGGYDHGARSVAIRLNHEAVTQVTGRSVKTISRFIKQHDIGRRAKRGNQLRRATLTGGQSHETSIRPQPESLHHTPRQHIIESAVSPRNQTEHRSQTPFDRIWPSLVHQHETFPHAAAIRHTVAVERHTAGIGHESVRDDVQQCAFAGTIAPEQTMYRTAP